MELGRGLPAPNSLHCQTQSEPKDSERNEKRNIYNVIFYELVDTTQKKIKTLQVLRSQREFHTVTLFYCFFVFAINWELCL
jgi:hypothetical protein